VTDFQPTNAQGDVLDVLVSLIGMSGVHKRPEQGQDIILDLLPAAHVVMGGDPFCVRVTPDGRVRRITDEEAGLTERPTPLEAMRLHNAALSQQITAKHEGRSE
jgi:hypothetical protein